MAEDTAWLPFWEGFRVEALEVGAEGVRIDLAPDPAQRLRCGGCGQPCHCVHERVQRLILELPMLGQRVLLKVQLTRVLCAHCGARLQRVSWLDPHARMTRRLAQAAAASCARLPVAHVAEFFGLHWSTVRELDRRRMQELEAGLPPPSPTRLVMDEFALFKGHRYACVILDADTRRVLWVAEGRTRVSVRGFFQSLGPAGCARIRAVAMDMNSAFDLEVRKHCPKARVIYDLFHVVAKYGRASTLLADLRSAWRRSSVSALGCHRR